MEERLKTSPAGAPLPQKRKVSPTEILHDLGDGFGICWVAKLGSRWIASKIREVDQQILCPKGLPFPPKGRSLKEANAATDAYILTLMRQECNDFLVLMEIATERVVGYILWKMYREVK